MHIKVYFTSLCVEQCNHKLDVNTFDSNRDGKSFLLLSEFLLIVFSFGYCLGSAN